MNKLDITLNRFPQFYNCEDPTSMIYQIVKAIIDEFDVMVTGIDKVDNMLGIDTTNAEDLESRWGNFLSLPRNIGESDEAYRSRLKLSVTSLSGGTKDAIKYAIAVGLGINNDEVAMSKIQIYDAWDYGGGGVPTDYGNIVCTVDLDFAEFNQAKDDIIIACANNIKVSGVQLSMIYSNYRSDYYIELDDITYASLDAIRYDQIGE